MENGISLAPVKLYGRKMTSRAEVDVAHIIKIHSQDLGLVLSMA